jgi:hypothetical protein
MMMQSPGGICLDDSSFPPNSGRHAHYFFQTLTLHNPLQSWTWRCAKGCMLARRPDSKPAFDTTGGA